jgi:hypothetical protein
MFWTIWFIGSLVNLFFYVYRFDAVMADARKIVANDPSSKDISPEAEAFIWKLCMYVLTPLYLILVSWLHFPINYLVSLKLAKK